MKEYCEDCGNILVKEPSVYYPGQLNTLCYGCQNWAKTETFESEEKAKEIAIQCFNEVYKKKSIGGAVLKQRRSRAAPLKDSVPRPDQYYVGKSLE